MWGVVRSFQIGVIMPTLGSHFTGQDINSTSGYVPSKMISIIIVILFSEEYDELQECNR
jgi:hypothetical protein